MTKKWIQIKESHHPTYRDKPISLRPSSLWVHDELDMVDLAKGFEDSSKHLLCNVEVQRTNIQTHGSGHALWH